MISPAFPIIVLYDGSCRACAGAVEYYAKSSEAGKMEFVDIASPDFRPEEYGRTREELMRRLHVIDAEGDIYLGVDGIMAIWSAFPPGSPHRLLARLVRLPGAYTLAKLGYRLFAWARKFLPKRKRTCEGGLCRFRP